MMSKVISNREYRNKIVKHIFKQFHSVERVMVMSLIFNLTSLLSDEYAISFSYPIIIHLLFVFGPNLDDEKN